MRLARPLQVQRPIDVSLEPPGDDMPDELGDRLAYEVAPQKERAQIEPRDRLVLRRKALGVQQGRLAVP